LIGLHLIAACKVMRPAGGLLPVQIKDVIGKRVSKNLEVGTAVTWDILEQE
jgi:sialic acid synthase SpsE